jgi:DNA segregation ATPase FtsK/SpoIIIE-like protein
VLVNAEATAQRRALVGDQLLTDAARYVIGTQNGSAAALQRRFGIGHRKATACLQLLEENGVVGHGHDTQPREVLTPRGDHALLQVVLDSIRSDS